MKTAREVFYVFSKELLYEVGELSERDNKRKALRTANAAQDAKTWKKR